MAEHFLTKSRVAQSALVTTPEGIVLERASALRTILEREAGSSAASLFAEPILGRPNDAGEIAISWYTDRAGDPRRLNDLDGPARQDVEERLTARLADVGRLLQSADLAPGIGGLLTVPNDASVWVVGGQPVITDWGILAPEAVGSDDGLNQSYARSLGRYLPLASAAASFSGASATSPTPQATGEPVAADTAPGTETADIAADTTGMPTTATVGGAGAIPPSDPAMRDTPQPTPPRSALWAIWPAVVLIVLLLILAIWLLLPTTRLFPPVPTEIERQLSDGAEDLARETNRALRERADALEDALNNAVCTDEGTLLLPNGRTPDGLLPPPLSPEETDPGASAPDAVPEVRDGDPAPLVPPAPSRLQGPHDGTDPTETPVNMLDAIERRTVLVIAQGEAGTGIGTGFFIGPDLVATNHHVIANAIGAGEVLVGNAGFDALKPAQILSHDGPFQRTGGDFAVLRVPGASQPFFKVVSPDQELRLQGVITAGYPADVIEADQQFQQLMDGDTTAMPVMVVTDGVVNAVQPVAEGIRLITHSAPISKGNSGGPLVDQCGRVVGMNTFVREAQFRNHNLAQSPQNLLEFFAQTGTSVEVDTAPCVPRVGPSVPTIPPATPETGEADPVE